MHSGLSHRRDWEDLARLDPLWAIASRPGLRHGGWSDDEFMASGRRKVARIMRTLGGLEQPVAVATVRQRRNGAMLSCTYVAIRPAA